MGPERLHFPGLTHAAAEADRTTDSVDAVTNADDCPTGNGSLPVAQARSGVRTTESDRLSSSIPLTSRNAETLPPVAR